MIMSNFNDIKGLAFDLDGVIADTARLHAKAWHQTADTVKTPWTPELAASLKGVGRLDSLELILKAGGHENEYSQAEKIALAAAKNDYYTQLVKALTPADILPGMSDFLKSLKAHGYKLALASSSRNAPTVLKYLGLTDYFSYRVDPAKLKHGKPDPEIYATAARLMRLPVTQVAGIEDAQAGIQAINAAGEFSIGIGQQLTNCDVNFAATADVTLDKLLQTVENS